MAKKTIKDIGETVAVINVLFELIKKFMSLIDKILKGKIDPETVNIDKWNEMLSELPDLEEEA